MRFIFLCLIFAVSLAGQDEQINTGELKSIDFELFTLEYVQKNRNASPLKLETYFLERLNKDQLFTEKTVRLIISAWIDFEREQNKNKIKISYQKSIAFIDAVKVKISNASLLTAYLLQQKAHLLQLMGDPEAARIALSDSVEIYDARKLEIDEQTAFASVQLAAVSMETHNLGTTEIQSLKIMGLPWWNIKENDSLIRMRDLYKRAVRLLIDSRESNVNALENIYIAPAMQNELLPILEEAIKRSGGNPITSPNVRNMKGLK